MLSFLFEIGALSTFSNDLYKMGKVMILPFESADPRQDRLSSFRVGDGTGKHFSMGHEFAGGKKRVIRRGACPELTRTNALLQENYSHVPIEADL